MPDPAPERTDLERDALMAVRAFSDAIDRMHGAMRGDMDMNASDLAALRMLIIREQRGDAVKPHDIAAHLAISTASTSKLIDRLTAGGYVERRQHPHDGRARVIVLTAAAKASFHEHFGVRLGRMRGALDAFDDAELSAATRFVAAMSDAFDPETASPHGGGGV